MAPETIDEAHPRRSGDASTSILRSTYLLRFSVMLRAMDVLVRLRGRRLENAVVKAGDALLAELIQHLE